MAHITEIGRYLYAQKLYWHTDRPPLLHRARTTETEPPFRVGECVIVRIPFTRVALVLGVWVRKSPTEEEALLNSMGARVTKDNGIRLVSELDW